MIEKWFTFFLGRGHAYSENGDGSRAGDSNNVDTTTSKCTHKHIRLFIPLLNVLWFVLLFLKLALNAHSSIHYDIQFISFKCRQYNAIKCAIDHRKRDDVKNWENAKKEKKFRTAYPTTKWKLNLTFRYDQSSFGSIKSIILFILRKDYNQKPKRVSNKSLITLNLYPIIQKQQVFDDIRFEKVEVLLKNRNKH